MKRKWSSIKIIIRISAISALYAIVACTAQKREDQLIPDAGKDLILVSDIEDKHFLIETLDSVVTSKVESGTKVDSEAPSEMKAAPSQKSTEPSRNDRSKMISTKRKFVNLPFVKIKTNDSLLETLHPISFIFLSSSFRGHPNHLYEAFYKLTDNSLKIYKTGSSHEIDFSESASAETLKDGRLAVPMVSYSVKYFVIEKIKNKDNEETNQLDVVAVDNLAKATHLKIDKPTFHVFVPIQKNNLFPKDYFEGEWQYAKPVQSNDPSVELKGSAKIVLNENLLVITDAKDDSSIIDIPIQWKDFEINPSKSDDISLEEKNCTTKEWSDRRFLALNSDKVINLEIKDDYFSFVLNETRYTFFKKLVGNL